MQRHLTKTIAVIASILCVMASLGDAAGHVSPNRAFDEYGPICWENEKARLDNFAIGLLNMPNTTLGHIIVYDGKRACRGEAIARAIRAKKYLVEYRKVPANRIVWRWGGDPSDPMTNPVIHSAGAAVLALIETLPVECGSLLRQC